MIEVPWKLLRRCPIGIIDLDARIFVAINMISCHRCHYFIFNQTCAVYIVSYTSVASRRAVWCWPVIHPNAGGSFHAQAGPNITPNALLLIMQNPQYLQYAINTTV